MTLRLGVMCCESAQQARLVREGLHALRTISQYRKKTIRANRTLTSHGGQGVKVFVMLDLLWSGRSSGEAVDGVDERLARVRCGVVVRWHSTQLVMHRKDVGWRCMADV
jgi:hypothetical protein